jgi:DNA-directed RNA polymerase specialized sigma24 family protein
MSNRETWLIETAEECLAAVTAVLYRRGRSPQEAADRAADAVSFAFSKRAYRECLRRVLALEEVAACLAGLDPDQRRLLLWLYVDQLGFHEVAAVIHTDATAVERQGHQAYDALRSRIAVRLGEPNDAFPVFPAAFGHGF